MRNKKELINTKYGDLTRAEKIELIGTMLGELEPHIRTLGGESEKLYDEIMQDIGELE